MLKTVLLLTTLIIAFPAHAKNASDIFESVSDSLVVVRAKSQQGKTRQGSGVVIANGEVVTNCHVLENASVFSVTHRKREHSATRKYSDPDRDVCSLTVIGLAAPAARLGSTKSLRVGQRIFAIGAPQGLDLTLSEGILSGLREVDDGRYLQITTPISPGSSGGGLFDDQGRLIGLPTFYLAEGQQLNFAVPVEWVEELPKRHDASGKSMASSLQSSHVWLNKAVELQEKKDWSGLLRHAQDWTMSHPEDASAWFALGIAYANTGQRTQAIEAYQKSLRIKHEDAEVWNSLGVVYSKAGQRLQAIDAYQQALKIDPGYAKAWNNLGFTYESVGQRTKAIEAYQEALRIDPKFAEAWFNLGNAYNRTNEITKAIDAYQKALRIDPEDADTWNNLGIAYKKANQTAKVMEVYRRLKGLDPVRAERFFSLVVMP